VIPTLDVNRCTKLASATGVDTASWIALNTATSNVPRTSQSRGIKPHLQFSASTGDYYAGDVYRIQFHNNPGDLKEPEIVTFLDGGSRSSLFAGALTAGAQTTTHKPFTAVWTEGQQGENIDYFGDHCDDVSVTIKTMGAGVYNGWKALGSLTTTEARLLKACLGGSDDDDTNNEGIYNWDMGSDDYPHLIKLVLTTTAQSDGGYYVALKSDGTDFFLFNPFDNLDLQGQNEYEIYTTQGVFARTSRFTEASVQFGSKTIITTNITADYGVSGGVGPAGANSVTSVPANSAFGTQMGTNGRFIGDISCENNPGAAKNPNFWVRYCVNKTDIVVPLSVKGTGAWSTGVNNKYFNLYSVNRIGKNERTLPSTVNDLSLAGNAASATAYGPGALKDEGTNYIDLDKSVNYWRESNTLNQAPLYIYKFFPNENSNYEYVAQCSNRGICNNDEGLCECFAGYTGDACQIQASLAV